MKIAKFDNFNIEGLCKIEFAQVPIVKSISRPDEQYHVTVTLKNHFYLSEILFTKTETGLEINQKEDESGTFYEIESIVVNPMLSNEKSVDFSWLEQKELIFILTDNNGYRMLIGSVEKPARLRYRMRNPATGRNQRTVIIQAVHDREPYFISEVETGAGGAFSDGFSNGFAI